ncbi:MAG: carbohydrate porin [Sterolibacterium sp.]|nr:carbohydrate porin [Sterolibacterium sp.]
MARPRLKTLALACALLGISSGQAALAAPLAAKKPNQTNLLQLLEKLNTRLDHLEKRNTELEQRLAEKPTPSTPSPLEQRITTLEQTQEQITRGLESERISENEPDLTVRLKAAEKDVLDMKHAAKKIGAFDGLSVGASLITVAQRPYGLPVGSIDNHSQLGNRVDITASLPLAPLGDIEHKVFAHFRMGQNPGLNAPLANLGAFANATNAVGFHTSGTVAEDSSPTLGEAWYQAAIPLPFGGFKPNSRETLELSFGKMDIFGFFDQNTVAGDEGRQFLNSVFVHNPLLDAGGQVGVDANGFQPGAVASYLNRNARIEPWRLSLGVFGTGEGARYRNTFSSPLVIAQAETVAHPFTGLTGNYRFYVWRSGHVAQLDGNQATQSGWGLSLNQQVSDEVALFARYGQQINGQVRFDRALAIGAEVNGSTWGRGADALGLAYGHLRSSKDFRRLGGSGDRVGDGSGLFAYAPGSAEHSVELYYRYRISKQFELSPDLQILRHAGANPDAQTIKILGLRGTISY